MLDYATALESVRTSKVQIWHYTVPSYQSIWITLYHVSVIQLDIICKFHNINNIQPVSFR